MRRLVQHPDPVGQSAQQRPVVAHQNDGSVIGFDGVLQRLDRLHVEVIGRLVEEQEVGARQHHHRQRHAGALAAREGSRLSQYRVAGETEPAQMALNQAALPASAAGR